MMRCIKIAVSYDKGEDIVSPAYGLIAAQTYLYRKHGSVTGWLCRRITYERAGKLV